MNLVWVGVFVTSTEYKDSKHCPQQFSLHDYEAEPAEVPALRLKISTLSQAWEALRAEAAGTSAKLEEVKAFFQQQFGGYANWDGPVTRRISGF